MNIIRVSPERMLAIKNGQKTATLREGIRDYKLGLGTILNSEDEKDKIDIVITRLELITFGKLNVRIVKEECYQSLKDLRTTLMSIYPDITEESLMTSVSFEVIRKD